MNRRGTTATSRPRRYTVYGFVPKARLTEEERARLSPRGRGLWLPMRSLAAWSPRGAVKKLVDQRWGHDDRVTRYRGELEPEKRDGSIGAPLSLRPLQQALFPPGE